MAEIFTKVIHLPSEERSVVIAATTDAEAWIMSVVGRFKRFNELGPGVTDEDLVLLASSRENNRSDAAIEERFLEEAQALAGPEGEVVVHRAPVFIYDTK